MNKRCCKRRLKRRFFLSITRVVGVLYLRAMSRLLTTLLLTLFVHCWTLPALAEYALHLKNGRRIVVQSYREEGRIIRFHSLGGEIGISKDQIQRIEKVSVAATGPQTQLQTPAPSPQADEQPLTSEEERAKEEKEYQQKLLEITSQLKDVRDRYSQLLRGTTSAEPSQLVTEEQIKASQADVISRFRDATSKPGEPAPVRLLTPSPFSSLPPTIIEEQPPARAPTTYENLPYNETQKEFSELRHQANELEREREKLINEMRQKNMNVGSLFLE
jgi:hypothetical protein